MEGWRDGGMEGCRDVGIKRGPRRLAWACRFIDPRLREGETGGSASFCSPALGASSAPAPGTAIATWGDRVTLLFFFGRATVASIESYRESSLRYGGSYR
jgi:hypothetical protein